MPGRNITLATDEIYHVFNRGVASQPIFQTQGDYQRAFESFVYYQNRVPPVKYSLFITQPEDYRLETLAKLNKKQEFYVEIICYCFMPNHFHFMLKQKSKNGISKFISNFINSYTRYFNTKNERNGHLFQGKFKAVHVVTDEQLLHLSRYVHLNPFTSFVVNEICDLAKYQYSSLPEYLNTVKTSYFNKEVILDNFKNIKDYKLFVFNQADYQRELTTLKHLIIEK